MNSSGRTIDALSQRLCQEMLEEEHSELEIESACKSPNPIVQLEIQLENGKKVYITPSHHDQPLALATQFCREHNLDADMIELLAQSITQSIHHSQESCKKQPEPLDEPTLLQITPQVQYPHSCKTHNYNPTPHYFSNKASSNGRLTAYDKGVLYAEQHVNWIERERQQKVREEMKECTHQPQINRMSRSMASERSLSRVQTPTLLRPEQDIYSKHRPTASLLNLPNSISSSVALPQHLYESKIELQAINTDESGKSRKIIRDCSSSVFMKLYQNRKASSVSRASAHADALRELTHHPSINCISKEIVGKTKFDERLAKYSHDKAMKQEKVRKNHQAEKENMHKPKIGLPPSNRNVDKLPIGDFLYQQRKKPKKTAKPKQQPAINHTSAVIYDRRKEQAFARIFKHLDKGKEGKIGWQQLDFSALNPQLTPILYPLLEELEIMGIELNQTDFKTAINYLFSTLSLIDKNILLNFHEKRQQPSSSISEDIFQPELNRHSQQLVQKMDRARMSIYDYCGVRECKRWEQIEQEKIAKERREMRECTFQPKVEKKVNFY